jgi:hypothetical protein
MHPDASKELPNLNLCHRAAAKQARAPQTYRPDESAIGIEVVGKGSI